MKPYISLFEMSILKGLIAILKKKTFDIYKKNPSKTLDGDLLEIIENIKNLKESDSRYKNMSMVEILEIVIKVSANVRRVWDALNKDKQDEIIEILEFLQSRLKDE